MTADALSVLQLLFTSIWSLFTSFYIPGTNVTPAGFAIFCLFFVVIVRFIHNFISESYHSEGK